jgi:hypothetical protein
VDAATWAALELTADPVLVLLRKGRVVHADVYMTSPDMLAERFSSVVDRSPSSLRRGESIVEETGADIL